MKKAIIILAIFWSSLQSITVVTSDAHSTTVIAPEQTSTVNINNMDNLGMTSAFGATWIIPLFYEKPLFPISATFLTPFKGNCLKPATLIITSSG